MLITVYCKHLEFKKKNRCSLCVFTPLSTLSHTEQDSHSVYTYLMLLRVKGKEGDNNPDYCVAKPQQKKSPS